MAGFIESDVVVEIEITALNDLASCATLTDRRRRYCKCAKETQLTAQTLGEIGRRLLLLGFVLVLLALVCALFIPLYANPRTGLAAHNIGITSGLLLIAVGLVFPGLALGPIAGWMTFWSLTVSVYVGFVGQVLAATVGLSRMFVVTAAGQAEGPAQLELLVEIATKAITPLTLLPCFLVVWGLARSASKSA
jgi:(hydroxyamino)benzene mutase